MAKNAEGARLVAECVRLWEAGLWPGCFVALSVTTSVPSEISCDGGRVRFSVITNSPLLITILSLPYPLFTLRL